MLDLGCGIGRHTVAFARMGLSVTATDVSASGLTICAAWLAREGLSASLVRHEMGLMPFPDCTFDGLVAYNVIYHTTVAGMNQVLAEVGRVIRPKGRLYATIIARRDSRVAGYRTDVAAGKCMEIEPFTFIYPRDAPGDKFLPHHYSDEREVRGFVAGFALDDMRLVHVEYADEQGTIQTGAHYHIQARRS
jgi:SAM-dependent methyltransferase